MKKLIIICALTLLGLTSRAQQVKYYLTDQAGQPWGSVSNITAMNTAFGNGGWIQGWFQTVNVNALLQPSVCLIYCDGGSMNATAMNNFLVANLPAIQAWVFNGGRLFLNAGPNTGNNMNYGFGGVTLNYSNIMGGGGGPYSPPGYATTIPAHPIYTGPAPITATVHNGNYYCHGYITGPGITSIICNTVSLWTTWNGAQQPNSGNVILASKPWGSGMCLFGSMTNTSFHNPAPSATNLRANMLTWLAVCCPQPTITAVANPTAICAGQSSTLTGGGAGVGGTYTWQPGGITGSVVVVTPTATTIYTVTGTTSLNCSNTRTVQVTVNPIPSITITATPSFVCLGSSSTLNLTGANTYTTNPGNLIGTPIIVSPTVTTTYTVAGTSTAGCVGTSTLQLQVVPLPTVTASNNGPVCAGSPLNLSVTTQASYTWSGPGAFASNLQFPTIPVTSLANNGQFTVAFTGAGGCSNTAVTNVVINPSPTLNLGSNSPVCQNTSLNLTGSGALTYLWSGPLGFTSNVANPVINPAMPANSGVYSLIGTGVGNCTAVANVTVTVNPLPNVTTGNHVVCENSPINHFANGATNYAWAGPGGFVSNLQNPVIPMASLAHNGQHVVVGTSAAGCTASAISNVTVIALPTASISANTPCVGGTLNLSGSGGFSYSWNGPNGFISISPSPSITNVSLLNGGPYTLMVASGICSNTAVYNVTINPLPNPVLNSNSPVCSKGTILINGSGGNSYTWAGPNNYSAAGTNIIINNASVVHIGTYTATATDMNGCSNTATIAVNVNPLPAISAVGSTLCATRTITMAATGGTAYTWSGPLGFSSTAGTVSIPNAQNENSGDYTITVTDLNGCSSTSLVNVHINPTPVVNPSSNAPLCASETIKFTANSPSGVQYIWSGPNNFYSLLQNPTLSNVGPEASGLYTVMVTDNIGCTKTEYVTVVVRNPPVVKVTSDKVGGCIPVCINFSQETNATLSQVKWDFGNGNLGTGNTGMACFTKPGIYNVSSSFVDVYGCSNRAYYSIEAYPIPVADFNISPVKPIINENVEFSDASYNANIAGWTWSFSNLKANQILSTQNVNIVYPDAGSYAAVLIVTSDKGCKDTIVKEVIVGDDFGIFVPDAFSPNGDGVNDIFLPKGFGIAKYELNVFDRWGEKLFVSTDPAQGWDGNFTRRKNEEVKQDVYVWKIKLTNIHGKTKELTGKVTILK